MSGQDIPDPQELTAAAAAALNASAPAALAACYANAVFL